MSCLTDEIIEIFFNNIKEFTGEYEKYIYEIIKEYFPDIFFIGAGCQTNEIDFLQRLNLYNITFSNITMHDKCFEEKEKNPLYKYTTEDPVYKKGTLYIAFNIGISASGSNLQEILESKRKNELTKKAYKKLGKIHFFNYKQEYKFANYDEN